MNKLWQIWTDRGEKIKIYLDNWNTWKCMSRSLKIKGLDWRCNNNKKTFRKRNMVFKNKSPIWKKKLPVYDKYELIMKTKSVP
jgi:hypothetical protein